jgi:hypothetical protein
VADQAWIEDRRRIAGSQANQLQRLSSIAALLLAMADLGAHTAFLAANLATSLTSFFRSHGLRSNSSYSPRPQRLRNPTDYHRRGGTIKPAPGPSLRGRAERRVVLSENREANQGGNDVGLGSDLAENHLLCTSKLVGGEVSPQIMRVSHHRARAFST